MTQPLVECEGLVHIYKTAELEVVNLLAGVEPPSAGAARVAGHDLARMDDRERDRYRREVVGYLLQHSLANLALDLTVIQNVQVPMIAGGPRRRGARAGANARELLDDLTSLLRDLGTAAIMVTHDQQLERHVDRVIQIRDGRTSTERRWLARPNGDREVADELVILDRAGRLQLPQAHVEKLGLRDRVRVHLDGDSIRITPAEKSPDAGS
jgi:predicted ABC-type transport system involved in lysophospholipase L1 biosynthesis ATPase subunit